MVETGTQTGSVPVTLSLSLSPTAAFGAFVPGIAHDYDASVAAIVTSTSGDSSLSVADPSVSSVGRLTNGSFALTRAVLARAWDAANQSTVYAPVTGSATPLVLLNYTGPVTADPVTIGLRQAILANEPLRTGLYAKTLTFTLATTSP